MFNQDTSVNSIDILIIIIEVKSLKHLFNLIIYVPEENLLRKY
jgi:hypothetical protein